MRITKELRTLSTKELREKLAEFKKELLKLNVEVTTGANPTSPGKVKQTKKNIARTLTLIKEKGVGSE